MEEDEEFVPTGEGNPELSDVCSKIFYETGKITYHNLSERFGEDAKSFDKNFPREEELTLG